MGLLILILLPIILYVIVGAVSIIIMYFVLKKCMRSAILEAHYKVCGE